MPKRSLGSRPTTLLSRKILSRLESSSLLQYPDTAGHDVDRIVDFLRSNFPDFRREKLRPFSSLVSKTLDSHFKSLPNPNHHRHDDDHDRNPSSSSPRKKRKKFDPQEGRILRHEAEFLRRRSLQQQQQQQSLTTSSSTSLASSHLSGSSDSEGEDGEEEKAVSTSEDAFFVEEPVFDLMKSMLRSNYESLKPRGEEKQVEIEDAENERKVDTLEAGSGRRVGNGDGNRNGNGGGNGRGGELKKGSDGPRFKDLGGMKGVVEGLMSDVIFPLCHPQLPERLGVTPMKGFLLHGPPGCGKTKLAHAIANETGVPFYKISAPEVVSGVSGASEENIRDLFSKAHRTAPSIVFIDEIDAIASKRENLQREMERRIVTQLMTCMDESHQPKKSDGGLEAETSEKRPGYVIVIGATNRPDAVDTALRRPGRFDREIELGIPDKSARAEILSVLIKNLKLEGTFDLEEIAKSTSGFVGADLAALVNKAGNLAMKRIIDHRKSELLKESNSEDNSEEWWRKPWLPEEMDGLSIVMADFEEAVKIVQPSLRREGFSEIPNVKWDDVGGLNYLRSEFDQYIVNHIKYPEEYEEFGINLETGFLLYGPPGCGKTLIAKAVANEAGANFIHIKGPELLNKYVGESELAVRTIFSRARTCVPCILFFDEVDALTTKRGTDGGWVIERLLNQLLVELDGADQRRGVYVIGATNRPEVMDPALLRPGRFGKLLYVPLPSAHERSLILKALARKKPVASDVDFEAIGQSEACNNFSGADLAAVMNEAALAALDERTRAISESGSSTEPSLIKKSHFDQALQKISPSVSDKQRRYYEVLSKSFKAA